MLSLTSMAPVSNPNCNSCGPTRTKNCPNNRAPITNIRRAKMRMNSCSNNHAYEDKKKHVVNRRSPVGCFHRQRSCIKRRCGSTIFNEPNRNKKNRQTKMWFLNFRGLLSILLRSLTNPIKDKFMTDTAETDRYEALGVDGVVREYCSRNIQGSGKNQYLMDAKPWLVAERRKQRIRADLRFWIPQAVAIFSAILATIAVVSK